MGPFPNQSETYRRSHPALEVGTLRSFLLGERTSRGLARAGKHIGTQSSSGVGAFYVEDALGSSRVLTTTAGVVCYDADFTPYGGEQAYTNSCPQNYKFEGKERDTETGNDDFGARYYNNRFGRWLSADWSNVPVAVPYANLSNPQTLNLYSMVADDPESFADLDGHQSLAGADPLRPGGASNEDCQAALETPKCTEDRQKIDQINATMQQQENALAILRKGEKALDSFNDLLGFGKTNCATGGDCINALGMAGTAVLAAVVSDGASDEAFVEKQLATAEKKINNIAQKLLTPETLEGAEREVNGGMKVAKVGGGFFDHEEKVKQGMAGLSRQAKHLEGLLERSGLSETHSKQIGALLDTTKSLLGTALNAITRKPL
jgi:RHS repeat-associated protein